MPGERFVIDPISEDPENTELDVSDGTTYIPLDFSCPPPDQDPAYASSADSEGDRVGHLRYRNRTVTLKLRVYAASEAALSAAEVGLQAKVAKLSAERGALRRTPPSGTAVLFDVQRATIDVPQDRRRMVHHRSEATLTFECLPFARGEPLTLSSHDTSGVPVAFHNWAALQFTETGLPGDVPGLGRLVIDDFEGVDHWFLTWGLRSRTYDSATSAGLVQYADLATNLAGSTFTASGMVGTLAGAQALKQASLRSDWVAIMSTQIAGSGDHLSHVGDYRVWGRVQVPTSNTGTVSVALEWGEGDYNRRTQNQRVDLDGTWGGKWRRCDLGTVSLTRVPEGVQRWEGRLVAKSTAAGDDVYVDYLMLIPLERSGQARALSVHENPTAFVAIDGFDQSAGALTGKSLPIGGNWTNVTGDDGADFAVTGTGAATRTVVSDAGARGRMVTGGTSTYDNVCVQAAVGVDSLAPQTARLAVCARVVDIDNYIRAEMSALPPELGGGFRVYKFIAGVATELGAVVHPINPSGYSYAIRLKIDTAGRWWMWFFGEEITNPTGGPQLSGQDDDLAAGGTLELGMVGVYDENTSATASTRTYNSFMAFEPATDAVIFRDQSCEIRHDRAIREDISGTLWNPLNRYEGDYLYVPPAGVEERPCEFIVAVSRNDPDTMSDTLGPDDLQARLIYTPRWLNVGTG